MRVPIDRIRDDGLQIDLGLGLPWAKAAAAEGCGGKLVGLEGHLEAEVTEDRVMVEGEATAEVETTCDRCAQAVLARVGGPIELAYIPAPAPGHGEEELRSDELEVGFYEEGVLDLAAVLQEHFALSVPYRLACDSLGVRPLEGSPCSASAPPSESPSEAVDPRFAVLKGLKLGES